MDTGVYQILNKVNGDKYIGSSAFSLRHRKNTHYNDLKKSKHCNKILQRAYAKYGVENFEFSILGYYPPEYCIKKEQWFIDVINPKYNICKKAGNTLGVKFSEQAKNKISEKAKGRIISAEARKKISISMKGRVSPNKGNKFSKEVCEKLSIQRKGRKRKEGIKWSEEARKRVSEKKKGKPVPKYFSEPGRLALLGKKHSIERVKKASETHSKFIYELRIPSGEIIKVRSLFGYCKENKVAQCALTWTLRGYNQEGKPYDNFRGYKLLSKTPIQEQQLQTA